MNTGLLTRILICLFTFCICLYAYLDKQNEVTELKIQIPEMLRDAQALNEENTRLQYEIDQFESPENLLYLARQHQFGHLHYPSLENVLALPEGVVYRRAESKSLPGMTAYPPTLVLGAKP